MDKEEAIAQMFASRAKQLEREGDQSAEIEALRARLARMEESQCSFISEIAHLKGCIAIAPCPNYQRKHGLGNGTCSDCSCWKVAALADEEET